MGVTMADVNDSFPIWRRGLVLGGGRVVVSGGRFRENSARGDTAEDREGPRRRMRTACAAVCALMRLGLADRTPRWLCARRAE
jgi:glutathione synthase/RimK-type ligase-like ATP-grasp enzyme